MMAGLSVKQKQQVGIGTAIVALAGAITAWTQTRAADKPDGPPPLVIAKVCAEKVNELRGTVVELRGELSKTIGITVEIRERLARIEGRFDRYSQRSVMKTILDPIFPGSADEDQPDTPEAEAEEDAYAPPPD